MNQDYWMRFGDFIFGDLNIDWWENYRLSELEDYPTLGEIVYKYNNTPSMVTVRKRRSKNNPVMKRSKSEKF